MSSRMVRRNQACSRSHKVLVVGLVGHVEPLVGPGEVAGGVEVGVVKLERVGPGVLVDVGAGAHLPGAGLGRCRPA